MYAPESDSEDELPPGWEERSTLQGEVYYANHDASTTQWTHPRTGRRKKVSDKLPFGWERKILDDNKVVYVDHANQRTTFTDPRLAFATERQTQADTFRQRFDGSTRALQVLHGIDLTGKVAVITGANAGIGFQTARALALHGCQVVLGCRSEERANRAIRRIVQERPAAKCTFIHLDLGSFGSVTEFARQLSLQHPVIDFLVLNAGVFGEPYRLTEDSVEYMMQVNFLSNFYLVKLLLKNLVSSSEARVVILSSESHRFSPVTAKSMDALSFTPLPSQFSSIDQYNASKLFCTLMAHGIHQKYIHLGVRGIAVHPGNLVNTNMKYCWWFYWLIFTLARPFTKSPDQGAGSVVFALCSPDLESILGFTYINNCFPTRPSPVVEDKEAVDRLWEVSSNFLESKKL